MHKIKFPAKNTNKSRVFNFLFKDAVVLETDLFFNKKGE